MLYSTSEVKSQRKRELLCVVSVYVHVYIESGQQTADVMLMTCLCRNRRGKRERYPSLVVLCSCSICSRSGMDDDEIIDR